MILSICKIYTISIGGICNRVKSIKGCAVIVTCMLCTSILHCVMFGDVTMKAKVNYNTQIINIKTMEESVVKSIEIRDKDNKVITSIAKIYPRVHMEVSEDQVGIKTAEVMLDFSEERIIELAEKTSEQQPLKVHIECPTDVIKGYIKTNEINHVLITIQIPDSIMKKENMQLEEIMLRQDVIETLIKNGKSITIRIIGNDKIERYAWFIDGKQQDKQAIVTDLNLMLRVRAATEIEGSIIEQLCGETNRKKEFLIINFEQSGVLPVQAMIRATLDYIAIVEHGDQIKHLTSNLKDGMDKLYEVDVNGQISLQISEGKVYVFEIIQ